VMVRTVWLALVFLIGVCGLAVLKVGIATPAKQQAAFAETTIGANADQLPLTKSDKLEVPYVDDEPGKIAVKTIRIVLPEAAPKPPEKITKIISRHWHERYAKMTARPRRDRKRPR
jgi:hypothetical protein